MICRTDIAEILANFNNDEAVKVVKHYYKTKHPVKYLGAKNEDYPKKNWSSVMLWNCSHWLNKQLTPKFVQEQTGNSSTLLHQVSSTEQHQTQPAASVDTLG